MFQNVVYINLEHRKDRNEQILKELERLQIPSSSIHRIDAVYNPKQGALGCSCSQIKAMEYAKEKDCPYVLVLEDDVQFHNFVTPEYLDNIAKELEPHPWDVMFVCCNVRERQPYDQIQGVERITRGLTASGYIVRRHYYDTVLQNFRESNAKLAKTGKNTGMECVDMAWFPLQRKDTWLALKPLIGKQRPSFSDILKRNVNYGV